ncbi:DUF4391 domain-containing protein [Allomuricauda sp. ARW1Y1]|jgi:hypothetical protein|uniref:DUF4391 domain-containing protein n=1 Tax=Allomuricauda sp. ARW1Y1 TaxID=2663843 RepID=UPI0015C9848D|nr:DUF4391 domain-containing protein [Muricauda sp. ARW1Y1]NYJ26621.1 hypothetical protein [Muricauda sp. ARW1Y1]
MNFFNLPARTKVGRVVPKNAFDEYTNTKQKKLFTDCILRITWTHKLSADTVNLDAKDIQEIQVFKVELKQKSDILKTLEIINKSIPYHIVFWVEHNQEAYISTASKHPHPTNEDIAVIDWTFTSDWFNKSDNRYALNLKGNLDTVFKDLLAQLTGKPELGKQSLDSILKNQQKVYRLKKEISKLKSAINRSKQFNQKVELNSKLNQLKLELKNLV